MLGGVNALTAAALAKGEVGVGHVEVIQKTLHGMRHLPLEGAMYRRGATDDRAQLL